MPTLTEAVSRAQYARRVRRLTRDLGAVESATLRDVLALLADLRREVLADLAVVPQEAGTWPAYRLRAILDSINAAAAETRTRLDAALRVGTGEAWRQGASFASTALGLDLPGVSVDHLVIAQSLQADLVAKVTDDFRARAAREVQMVVAGVRSPHEATQAVSELLRTQPGRVGMGPIAAQAERVVRTEVNGVFALADQARDEQIKDELPDMRKWWSAARDSRTRPDHLAADGRYRPGGSTGPIALSDDFMVGGERAAGPHDPRLSAAQRVHCRCVRMLWSPEW